MAIRPTLRRHRRASARCVAVNGSRGEIHLLARDETAATISYVSASKRIRTYT